MSDNNFPRDYYSAMKRHWQDAELLRSQEPQRLANADHLYGLAAECGLKALMEKADNPLDVDNNQAHSKKYKKHINATWAHYEDFRNGRLATYALGSTNNFDNWLIDQRYAAESHFDDDRIKRHRLGAKAVYDLVAKAEDEGLLP